MKTLNKKNLKIINDFLFEMIGNDNHISSSEKEGSLSLKDEAFNHYLFWNTRALSIELYENYGICYYAEKHQEDLLSEKEDIIKKEKEACKDWQEAERKFKVA